ncbi:MAG: HAMP domain-containing sensor histidine kinase [Pseudomonadota bacterium]
MRGVHSANSSFLGLLATPKAPETDLDHEIALTQQKVYLSNSTVMAAVNLLNSTVLAISFIGTVDLAVLVSWYFCVLPFSIGGFYLARKTKHKPVPTRSSGKLLRKAEFSSIILGFIWGIPNLAFPNGDPVLSMFVMLVTASTAAGYVSLISAAPRLTSRFVFFAAVPIFMTSIVGIGAFSETIGWLSVVLVAGLINGSILSYKQLAHSVKARLESDRAKTDLNDAIEAIDDAFAIFSPEGLLARTNSRFRYFFPNGLDLETLRDGEIFRVNDDVWLLRSIRSMPDGRTVCLHKDVTGLKHRESQLISARREAEDANAAKARFMSTMSHELRTPLNIINGFSKIMSSSSKVIVTASEMREYSDSMLDAGEHLLAVINDIIEFSQVGSDRFIHEPAPEDVRELLSKAISLSARFQAISDLSGIDISVGKSVGDLIVDEAAFRRVLMSLLSNAFKFSGQPTRIVVRAFVRPDGCPVISIRDFGTGIEETDLERVFEPFYQGENVRRGHFVGTGLGLALARELMRLHGGRVELASRLGVGTTVSVLLPASAHIPRIVEEDDTAAKPSASVRAVA